MKRDELLSALRESRAQMEQALSGLSEAQMTASGAMGEWSVKDLLTHLTAWEAEAVTALAKTKRGLKPNLPKDSEVDAFNAKWYAENKARPLDRVLADWRGVRTQMLRQVESLTDHALAQPRAWLGGEALSDMIRSETCEHEAEHLPHLQEWRRKAGV
jgi:uncharacterized protein (TIGR03083 family)